MEAFIPDGQQFLPFDEFIRPSAGTSISAKQLAIYGLMLTDFQIQTTGTIEQVWPHFVNYVKEHLDGGNKKGVMVA